MKNIVTDVIVSFDKALNSAKNIMASINMKKENFMKKAE
jgi:hypothetical protein